jgi:hypothetical protein
MKKTCSGCCALDDSLSNGVICELGYKNEKHRQFQSNTSWIDITVPVEDCPKPRTIKKYMELKNIKNDKKGNNGKSNYSKNNF